MKIVLQHPHQPHEISGVLTYVTAAAGALRQTGHDVRILASAGATSADIRALVRWADVVHLTSHEWRSIAWATLFRRPLVQHYHFPFWGFWRMPGADAVTPGFWVCLYGSIAVPWSHGKGWRMTRAFARYFGSSAGRVVMRLLCASLADARLAVSEFIARDACLPGGMTVVYNPIDFDVFQTASHRPFPNVPRFTFVGRLASDKGPQILVEAAALLRQTGAAFDMVIVGDGKLRPELEARVRELSLQDVVSFAGQVTREDAANLMAASTAVVVPSLCDDPAPYAVMEASALRRPCIGSAHGGIPEIIGPGIVLHDDTPRTLAAAMHQLAVDRPAAIALGQRCYDFAFDRFRPQRVADALVAVYRRVAAH